MEKMYDYIYRFKQFHVCHTHVSVPVHATIGYTVRPLTFVTGVNGLTLNRVQSVAHVREKTGVPRTALK